MSAYWIIIVLVILFTKQLNALVLLDDILEVFNLRDIPYDDMCTRLDPVASVDEILGLNKIYYSEPPMENCTTIKITATKMVDVYTKEFTIWGENEAYKRISAHEITKGKTHERRYNKPRQKLISLFTSPQTIVTVAVYKKGVGYGLIGCPPHYKSKMTSAMIVGYPGATKAQIDAIKVEVERISKAFRFGVPNGDGIQTKPVCPFN
ncbi:hypothetical protein CHUAL_000186 [Chamberlinius hualienensis]